MGAEEEPVSDEIERRVVAHELVLIEVPAPVRHKHRLEAIESIRVGFVIGIAEEERLIRIVFIELLEDAMRRHEPAATGMFLQRQSLR